MVKILKNPRSKEDAKEIKKAMGYNEGAVNNLANLAETLVKDGDGDKVLLFILRFAPNTLVGGYLNHGKGTKQSGKNSGTEKRLAEIEEWVRSFINASRKEFGEFKNADDNTEYLSKPNFSHYLN